MQFSVHFEQNLNKSNKNVSPVEQELVLGSFRLFPKIFPILFGFLLATEQ
jgi:hypothetical protein